MLMKNVLMNPNLKNLRNQYKMPTVSEIQRQLTAVSKKLAETKDTKQQDELRKKKTALTLDLRRAQQRAWNNRNDNIDWGDGY